MPYISWIDRMSAEELQYQQAKVRRLETKLEQQEKKFDEVDRQRDVLLEASNMRRHGCPVGRVLENLKLPTSITEKNFDDQLIKELNRTYFSLKNMNGRINTTHSELNTCPSELRTRPRPYFCTL